MWALLQCKKEFSLCPRFLGGSLSTLGISQMTGVSLVLLVAPQTTLELMLSRWLMVGTWIVSGWGVAVLDRPVT